MQLDLPALSKSKDPQIREFAKGFKYWKSLFDGILQKSPQNPNVHSLVLNLKLIILVAYADAFGKAQGSRQKFINTLSSLSVEEKFFLCLVFEMKKINRHANSLAKQYEINQDKSVLNEFKQEIEKEYDDKDSYITDLLNKFYKKDQKFLHKEFKERLRLLYDIRSNIVHRGSPQIGTMLGSNVFALYGESGDTFFSADQDLEDFFIRALLRKAGHTPDPIAPDIEVFLFEHHLGQHGDIVMKIVYEKLRKQKHKRAR